ncbi:MAG: hypothetical protein UW21_C0012G0002 [Candidatus Woesebacteria bacterium GW2011_GWB1_44_11b]|uniref:Uncharacterized protein n=1 Tax=Candidatus Woesebacteria bacterium GW2011_GWB1_44_11b TaxID=1618580 RepID=A0A0G1INH1_9BACT|nr:MAG: hypothetical protein UW21_C0012G0002 [Candidatus Woesebacteria bacterium GW2011_GWB1_44_11b]
MSAEKLQDFKLGVDGEIESLLVPSLTEEREVIENGKEEVARKRVMQQQLFLNRIIPGIEARKEDLGNFCTIFQNGNDEVLMFTQIYPYLAMTKDGIFRVDFNESTDESLEGVFALLLTFSKDRQKRIKKEIGGIKYEIKYGGHRNTKRLLFKAQDNYHWDGECFWRDCHLVLSEMNINTGLELIVNHIKSLEEETVSTAELYETGQHEETVALDDNINKLRDLSAMLPEPPKHKSRLQRAFQKPKNKGKH